MIKPWIVYLSGPITGERDAKQKFEAAEKLLRESSPAVYTINPFSRHPAGLTNAEYMRLSFAEIDAAHDVALLPGWEDSDGCNLELAYADYIGKHTFELAKRFPEAYAEEMGTL